MAKLVNVSIYHHADKSVSIDLNDGIIIASNNGKFPEVYLIQSIDDCILHTGQMRCVISQEDAKKLLELGATPEGYFKVD